MADEGTGLAAGSRGVKKVEIGTVVSDKMDKTVTVKVEHRIPHPVFGKIVRKVTKYKAHDEQSEASEGDIVEIVETRPLSKTKRWRLVRVVQKASK